MNKSIKNDNHSDQFDVLRKVSKNPKTTQRKLSNELDLSLGKINYCLKALIDKGLIKIKNFSKNNNKISYVYILTPKGIKAKTRLTLNFMKKKMREYEELKREKKEVPTSELFSDLKDIAENENIEFDFRSARSFGMHFRHIVNNLREHYNISESRDERTRSWRYKIELDAEPSAELQN